MSFLKLTDGDTVVAITTYKDRLIAITKYGDVFVLYFNCIEWTVYKL